MAKLALLASGAIALAAGGAVLGFALTREPPGGISTQGTQAMDAAIAALDADVRAARTAVAERAKTLAGVPAVQAAIPTDQATAKEMVERGELKFEPQPGEVIELEQVPNGQGPATLIILPADARPTPHAGKPGEYVEMIDDKVVVTEIAPVTPKYRADELTGFVAVARPLDLGPALDRLVAAGVAGRFELAGKTRAIGAPSPGATERPMSLPSQPAARLVVAVPPAQATTTTPWFAAAGGAGLLGLVRVIAGVAGNRTRATASAPAIGSAATQLSGQGVSAGASTSQPIAAHAIEAGQMIGRWEVVRRLGSGGMADVYLARARGEAGFEKLVAIKVMHAHLARNQRAVDLFLDEARLAARIAHPNVVQIQDLGKIGDDYVIVMEYVDGVDLERLLMSARGAQRQVPVEVALGILCRICDGLNAAHKATAPDGTPLHVIHRDVKAANVLVSKQGGVKVVDFGIAKAAKQGHMTVAGETKGTPSMMAPEQRLGEQVDVRVDVYSVGAVGFEILTGQGVNLDLAALAHLGTENWPHLPPPTSLRPQLPPELDRMVLDAMAFERERRPADCAAFEAALETVMKRHGLTASDKDIARWVSSELAVLA